jgi:hypothetical protein
MKAGAGIPRLLEALPLIIMDQIQDHQIIQDQEMEEDLIVMNIAIVMFLPCLHGNKSIIEEEKRVETME